MITLQHLPAVSAATALATGALAYFLVARPAPTAAACAALPRHRLLGVVFAGLALLLSALLIDRMPLGGANAYKWLLYLLTPAAFLLVVTYLDELLAARALGGLLLLAPVAMVDAARWHPSPLRYVLITFAYLLVVAGILLVLSPYKFRLATTWLLAAPTRRLAAAALLGLTALLLATLAFTA
jgi:hypothetical protein